MMVVSTTIRQFGGLQMKYYSISEAAALCNIPKTTLRYYDKKGLLPLIERDEAGRRHGVDRGRGSHARTSA
jgi:hypothetical protein